MKKLFIIVAALFVVVSFSACSDDEGGGKAPAEMRYVKTISFRNYIINIEYDEQHRIIKFGNWELVYNGNTVQIMYLSSSQSIPYARIQLNNAGNVITRESYDNFSKTYKTNATYEYDSAGRLIRDNYILDDISYSYRWKNGNRYVVGTTGIYENEHGYVYTDAYTTHKTPPCNLDFSTDGPSWLDAFGLPFGKQCSNLVEIDETSSKDSDYVEGNRYTYEFDKDGYISKIVQTWYSNGEKDERTVYEITYY